MNIELLYFVVPINYRSHQCYTAQIDLLFAQCNTIYSLVIQLLVYYYQKNLDIISSGKNGLRRMKASSFKLIYLANNCMITSRLIIQGSKKFKQENQVS
jgi:hypothetical protein